MIGRGVVVKVVAFATLTVLAIGYVLVHYVGVGIVGGAYTAYVDLPDSGGIFTTASVTYRGVEVGRVGAITLTPAGIRVALDITGSQRIPANVRVVVGNGSPIGEQFVDLQPQSAGGPYLHAGSVIPAAKATLPVQTQDLLVSLDRLVTSVPKADLSTLIGELGAAFGSTGPDLQRLLDASHQLLATARQALPDTAALVGASGPVLDTQNRMSNSIVAFAHNLATFTGALRAGDLDLRRVLANGVPASTELAALDHSVDATLPILLGNLVSLGQVTAVRVPALRQILIIYPYVVATSFGLFPGNGSTRFGIPIPPQEDVQPCETGYLPPSQRRLPDVLAYPAIRWDSFCKAPVASNTGARGSREAPEPGGGRLGNDPSYLDNAGLPGAQMYDVASTGGEQRLLGDNSWTYLLLGPLS